MVGVYANEKFNGIKADDVKTKLSAVLSGYVNAVAELDTSKVDASKLSTFERIQKSIGKLHEPIDDKVITAQKQSLDNISKFIDKANSIDTNKIKSTADMLKQMSKLSESIKGNFDGLAEALNENLLTVLKDLKEWIGECINYINLDDIEDKNQKKVHQKHKEWLEGFLNKIDKKIETVQESFEIDDEYLEEGFKELLGKLKRCFTEEGRSANKEGKHLNNIRKGMINSLNSEEDIDELIAYKKWLEESIEYEEKELENMSKDLRNVKQEHLNWIKNFLKKVDKKIAKLEKNPKASNNDDNEYEGRY